MINREPATICFPFTGDAIGGSHISVLGLIRNLDRSRYRPLILPQRPDGAVAALFREHRIEIEQSFHWTEPPFDMRIDARTVLSVLGDIRPQIRFLRSKNVAIVHSNDGRTHATWALPARLAGAKLLWHHRGNPGARGLRFAAPLLAHEVVAVSRFALPRPGLFSAASKAEVVHSPFDITVHEDRPAARTALLNEFGYTAYSTFIGYIGTFVDDKCTTMLLIN